MAKKRAKHEKAMKKEDAKMKKILTAEQYQKWQEMKAKKAKHHAKHGDFAKRKQHHKAHGMDKKGHRRHHKPAPVAPENK